MKGLFLDAVDDLATCSGAWCGPTIPPVDVQERGEIRPESCPDCSPATISCFDDHTQMPTEAMRALRRA